MTSWIQTKAGLQMAETIIRQLPRITVCLEQLAKQDGTLKDIIKLADEMDVRKQENNNLKFQIDKLKDKINTEVAISSGDILSLVNRVDKIDQKYHTLTEILRDKITRLETIIEERK